MQKQDGFTLVELMIVIAIIGILAATLFPAIAGYRERAYDVDTRQKVRLIGLAVELRFANTGNPIIAGGGWIDQNTHVATSFGWMDYEGDAYYPKSDIRVLEEGGYLTPGKIPILGPGSSPIFMYYACGNGRSLSVSAKLKSPNREDLMSVAYSCNGTIDGSITSNATYDRYGRTTAITVAGMCSSALNTSGSGTFYNCDGSDKSDHLYNHILQHAQPYPGTAYGGTW